MVFEAGKIHYEGHWKWWALEIETFLGLGMATSEERKYRNKKPIKKAIRLSNSLTEGFMLV